mmetsp:Transcript_29409/g.56896  ORF Transcript_29409/g.56896 Transcript_29409/m.56896 type:complete len:126 (-) Transcript_29409:411-788(-)
MTIDPRIMSPFALRSPPIGILIDVPFPTRITPPRPIRFVTVPVPLIETITSVPPPPAAVTVAEAVTTPSSQTPPARTIILPADHPAVAATITLLVLVDAKAQRQHNGVSINNLKKITESIRIMDR